MQETAAPLPRDVGAPETEELAPPKRVTQQLNNEAAGAEEEGIPAPPLVDPVTNQPPAVPEPPPEPEELSEEDERELILAKRAGGLDRDEVGLPPDAVTDPVDPQPQPAATPEAHGEQQAHGQPQAPQPLNNAPFYDESDGIWKVKRKVYGVEEDVPYDQFHRDAQKVGAVDSKFQNLRNMEKDLEEREAEIARREAALQAQPPAQPGAVSPVPSTPDVQQGGITIEDLNKALFDDDQEAINRVQARLNGAPAQPAPASQPIPQPVQPSAQQTPVQQPDMRQIAREELAQQQFETERVNTLESLKQRDEYKPYIESDFFIGRVRDISNQLQQTEPGYGPKHYLESAFASAHEEINILAQQAAPQPVPPVNAGNVMDTRLDAKRQHSLGVLGQAASARAPAAVQQQVTTPDMVKQQMREERDL